MSFGKRIPKVPQSPGYVASKGHNLNAICGEQGDNLLKVILISFAAVIAWIVIFIGFSLGFISGSPEVVLRYFFWILCFLGLSYWIEHFSRAIGYFRNKPSCEVDAHEKPELSESAKLQKKRADAFLKWFAAKTAIGATGFVATLFLLQIVTGKPMLYLTQELMQGRIEGVEFKNVYKNFDDVNQALSNIKR